MTARHNNMYLEIYGTRTPRYDTRPSHRAHAVAAALAGAVVMLLVLAPDTVTWVKEVAADMLARLP